MSVSEESWYGGSEELALTGTTRADPAVRCHIILSSTAPTIFKLPRASMQANEGGGNHWVFNFGTNAISLRDYSNGLILALAQDEGAICSLVDNGSDAGEWRAILYTIDAGPAPSPPVFGYFIGGEGSPSTADDCREWNPGAHVWTVYADTITGYGFSHGAVSFVVGDNLYIQRDVYNTTHMELTTPDTWTSRTDPPLHEYDGCGCGLNDGVAEYGYTFGGHGGGTTKEAVEIYSAPPADSWSSGVDQPTGMVRGGATPVSNKAYVMGGRSSSGGGWFSQKVEEYDPGQAPDTWTTKTDMPQEHGRGDFGHAEADGMVFVICGAVSTSYLSGINVRDTNERYNPTSDEWEQRQIHPIGRRADTTAVGIADLIYLVGGIAYDGPEYPVNDPYTDPGCQEYNNSTDSWTTETDMNQGVQRWENHCQAVQT
jgi:hypothetical protein